METTPRPASVTGTRSAPGLPSAQECHRARVERDPAWDGRLFFAVTSTGVFCRPVCPARRARAANVRYFSTAAAAAEAGFRPCLRCRPERAPARRDGDGGLVGRALEAVDAGALDEGDVASLARDLGVGERRLRRLFERELGVGPVQCAQVRRLLMARDLLLSSEAPVIDVAYAAGFSSLRRFNESFREHFGTTPSGLRSGLPSAGGDLELRVGLRPPFAGGQLMGFLAARAVPRVETVEAPTSSDGPWVYRRTFRLGGATGTVSASWHDGARELPVTIRFVSRPDRLPGAVDLACRIRHLFDVAFDPAQLAPLRSCPVLGPRLALVPGIRVPGCFDPFELGVRIVLGQQVSVAGARTLVGRLAARWGRALDATEDGPVLFPEPGRLVDAPVEEIGLPAARARSLRSWARLLDGTPDLFARTDADDLRARLLDLPGFGPWSAEMLCMRGLHAQDALAAGDLVLRQRLAAPGAGPRGLPTARQVEERAEAWRPFRAYAAMLLWAVESIPPPGPVATDASAATGTRARATDAPTPETAT